MPSQCVAWNCSTRRTGDESDDQTITFHSFPTNQPELLQQWLKVMGETLWKPQRGSVLCSKHFDRSSFLQNYATPRLKQGAVPVHCQQRPNAGSQLLNLDEHAARVVDGDAKRGRKRKIIRRYDPEEEIANLRLMLEDERIKRRELEQEIYRMRQEKSEMNAKMSKLEASKCKPNIPQSLIPILVDAMAKNVDPLKKPDLNRAKRPVATSKAAPSRAGTTKPATATTTAPKLMLQLPEQILDTNSSKSVSFMVPVSANASAIGTNEDGGTIAEAPIVDVSQGGVILLDV
ncbi:hypothetical protein BV898_12553 [Hypsibius exemplaris]|uniref:THAP-type domain-containing protein n=1 Tax=Hypsibius exemplaris TaxID=2072580 RepID=A0A1W0WDF3_HYPEX|nr:hypothetical protein BV898_12553 [Hypsibius exemplaris]